MNWGVLGGGMLLALQGAADQAGSLANLLADEELRHWHVVRVGDRNATLRNSIGEWADIDVDGVRLVVTEHGKDAARDRREWYAFTGQPTARSGDPWDDVWGEWRQAPMRCVTVLINGDLGWRLIARYGWQGVVDVEVDAVGVVVNARYVTGDGAVELLNTWQVRPASSGPVPQVAASWAEMVASAYLASGHNVRLAADDSMEGSLWRLASYGGPTSPAVRVVTVDVSASWSWEQVVPPSLLTIGVLSQVAEAVDRGSWFPSSGTPSEEGRRLLRQWAARTALAEMGDRLVVESVSHEPGRRSLDGPPLITVHREHLEHLA